MTWEMKCDVCGSTEGVPDRGKTYYRRSHYMKVYLCEKHRAKLERMLSDLAEEYDENLTYIFKQFDLQEKWMKRGARP